MINRRLLRIKVVQILFSYYNSTNKSLAAAEKELQFSIEKAYELYHYFLLLPNELAKYAQKIIDRNKTKQLPSEEDLNPNLRFVDNRIVTLLRENDDLIRFQHQHKISWVNQPELIKELYLQITSSTFYEEFMNGSEEGFESDKTFWTKVYKKLIPEFTPLGDLLEELSIYWNDDSELVLSMAMKTIKGLKEDSDATYDLMPLYKDEDDKKFSIKLLRGVILKDQELQQAIEEVTKHWDMDRLAFMDNLLMKAALAEIIEFKNIPVKVSLNEYIEIAKNYSTPKSGLFINGVLDSIVIKLTEAKKIKKVGRGLME